jgi:hypothetical protein
MTLRSMGDVEDYVNKTSKVDKKIGNNGASLTGKMDKTPIFISSLMQQR